MYSEDELLPLSALQHLVFCARQCALIHVEQQWEDNALTLEGSHLHDRVDETAPRRQVRGDLVVLRALPLRSFTLGLAGKADTVEFHRAGQHGVSLAALSGLWTVFPVEYKRGKPKPDRCDEVQVCAQALCLEEMLNTTVECGALFYGRTQRRVPVSFDRDLRQLTAATSASLHRLFWSGDTPPATMSPKCKRCSLQHICLPETFGRQPASRYIKRALQEGGE